MMHSLATSLEALQNTPDIAAWPNKKEVLIVGSAVPAIYATLLEVSPKETTYGIGDIDICIPTQLYAQLGASGWTPNHYRGVHTLRRNITLAGHKESVQVDAGTQIGQLSYEQARVGAIPYLGYLVLHPRTQLNWYTELNRSKDLRKIELLETQILPRVSELGRKALDV